MVVWTGGLGISDSGSEADQCVTAASFNLSFITQRSCCIPASRPQTCYSRAGKEGLGWVARGSHAHNFFRLPYRVFYDIHCMGGWQLSALLWIHSPWSEAVCNEACSTTYLAMNNYNPMIKCCWQTSFNNHLRRHAVHFWMYIIRLIQDCEFSPNISGWKGIRACYLCDAAVRSTRKEKEEKPGANRCRTERGISLWPSGLILTAIAWFWFIRWSWKLILFRNAWLGIGWRNCVRESTIVFLWLSFQRWR